MAHSTMQLSLLELSAQETYDWLDRIGLELDDSDRRIALQTLRAVLHALRDYLSIEQSAHLAAQFPTFIRGLYFEQWTPDAAVSARGSDEFLIRVDRYRKGYTDRCSAEEAARAVFGLLEESLSGGGEKIKQSLPKPIRALWD
jgi:uncharacterized protein (DUF2267 family)